MKKGIFISFEGIDGAGKSKQIELLVNYLERRRKKVVSFREPGGTLLGEDIRKILSSPSYTISPWSEVFLFLGSRVALLEEKLIPLLNDEYIVIMDRFIDSTYAYQGYGRGLPIIYLRNLHFYAGITLVPDITFLLDISPEIAFKRIHERGRHTRIERFGISFFQKVREGYLSLYREESNRIKLIDAERDIYTIHKDIVEIVEEYGVI